MEMAVGAIGATPPQVKSGYIAPSPLIDEIKSLVVPAGAWLYNNAWKPSQGIIRPAGNFWKELGSSTLKSNVMSALTYDGIGSVVRNGIALFKGQITPARGAGNIVADVGIGAGKGILAGLAVTAATMGITAIGLTVAPFLLGVPAIVGAMAVSWGAYKLMDKALAKTGLHKKISDGVAGMFGGDK